MADLLRRLRAQCPRSRAVEPVGVSRVDGMNPIDRLEYQITLIEGVADVFETIAQVRRAVTIRGEVPDPWDTLGELARLEGYARLELEATA